MDVIRFVVSALTGPLTLNVTVILKKIMCKDIRGHVDYVVFLSNHIFQNIPLSALCFVQEAIFMNIFLSALYFCVFC